MKPLIVTILAIFVSTSVYARNVDFDVSPKKPLIVQADLTLSNGETFHAPWFKTNFLISNKSATPITIVGLNISVTSSEGTVWVALIDLGTPTEVSANGGVFNVQDFIVDGLPISESYKYKVKVDAMGWIGSINEPAGHLNLSAHFKTR